MLHCEKCSALPDLTADNAIKPSKPDNPAIIPRLEGARARGYVSRQTPPKALPQEGVGGGSGFGSGGGVVMARPACRSLFRGKKRCCALRGFALRYLGAAWRSHG